MIFNSNTTKLNALTINAAMLEDYDCSYGASLALVECAESDYAMFCAMLNVDARELQIKHEASEYLVESQLMALKEAATSGIWQKIAEALRKAVEKVKAFLASATAKIREFLRNDEVNIKKYSDLIKKFMEKNPDAEAPYAVMRGIPEVLIITPVFEPEEANNNWADTEELRLAFYLDSCKSVDEYKEKMFKVVFPNGTETTDTAIKNINLTEITEILKVGGVTDRFGKIINGLNKISTNKIVNQYKKAADKENTDEAKRVYDMAIAFQTAIMTQSKVLLEITKVQLTVARKAFYAILAMAKKGGEVKNETYFIALGEAVAEEVDEVINCAISKEDFDDINKGGLDIKDASVSDDPDALTYDPDKYTSDSYGTTAGTIDTEINSREESAFFGALFY